jgi:O-acetyl-ADP-ribose deacetylase (regulator of RNase III)
MPGKTPEVKSLYYITHIDNLASILQHGILAHQQVLDRRVAYTPVYDASIVRNRQGRKAPSGRSLWEFANVYFQPRNPMLYRVLHEKDPTDLVVIGLRPEVLSSPGAFVALGNAASAATEILPSADAQRRIAEIWDTINAEWWNALDGSKRKIMAECLVPESIPSQSIHTVFVVNHETAERVRELRLPASVSVVPEPAMFFRPVWGLRVADRLSLVEGDMFFSTMQTLTVSVNVVGVMGKGLASRAKYQFPDVYVAYQDACRSRELRIGKPYLYKREAFVDEELADEPGTLPQVNANKWFLLFPTKRHWRDASRIEDIQAGLRWLRESCESEGIQSLAMPALGCGLGGLDWRDVGPVMCRALHDLGIGVAIYLPRERQIPKEYLSADYLLAPSRSGRETGD